MHTTLDYPVCRDWAAALAAAGWKALRHLLRGDVAGRQAGRAVFGHAGLASRAPAGMSTTVTAVDIPAATAILAARGVEVLPVPHTVPIVPDGYPQDR